MQRHKTARRDFIKKATVLTVGGIALSAFPSILKADSPLVIQQFGHLPLPYAYDSLEPHIDAMTMEIHHAKHYKGYVDKLNAALREHNIGTISPSVVLTIDEICRTVSKYPEAIRNNGGGYYNHSLFWLLMKPNGGGAPTGALAEAIKNSFNSFEEFKTKFSENAAKVFGSGWTWLVVNKNKKLEIGSSPNQDNPLMDISTFKGFPVLALDVWEHAYYLKHQNKRNEYIASWWNVVNWDKASELYDVAIK